MTPESIDKTATDTTPIVLVPGMAADATVFEPVVELLPGSRTIDWIAPRKGETLGQYAERMAADLPSGCLLGGASFGGIVALEMARYVRPSAVVLVGSIRSPEELPRWIRKLRGLDPLTSWAPVRPVQWLLRPLDSTWVKRRNALLANLIHLVRGADPKLLHWSIHALFRWREQPELDCPVWRVHGEHDAMFPPAHYPIDHRVADGGHVISLSHPEEVADFLGGCRREVEAMAAAPKIEPQGLTR